MAERKFYALFLLMALFTATICSGGCGGGGSSSSFNQPGQNTTPITSPDRTPTPTPTPIPTPIISPDPIPTPTPTPITSPDTTPTPIPTPTPTPVTTYYTVTFDSNGGSDITSQRIISGGTATRPEDPVRDGYNFTGWYIDKGLSVLFVFGENGDKVTQDITLYARWTEAISPALAEAEYALSHVAIGYQAGDNPNYVTQNLTLPASSDVEGVAITWTTSNPSAISTAGNVNRQADDTKVILTAKAEKDSQVVEKTFELTVIRKRSKTPEQAKAEIQTIGVTEIRAMNASNDELQITYTASRDRVTDIDGKYTDITINTADDALDAVQSLHGILGISDPYEELEANVITSDTYGAEYTFSQVYNGVRVFGRNVTVSANGAGEGDFIASSIVPSSRLAESNLNFTYTKDQAGNAARNYYYGSFDIRENMTEKLIFTLENYENNPVPAYVVSVYGIDNEGGYIDENLFVNARNGEVIYGSSNIYTAVETRTARNEMNVSVDFPVINVDTVDFMIDPATKVRILERDIGDSNLVRHPVNEAWNDGQQISAYTNMIEIMKWWKDSFDRNSIDGCGMTVDVVTHLDETEGFSDNAAWCPNSKGTKLGGYIAIGDPSSNQRSQAVAMDVLAHESTHGVFMFQIGQFVLSGGKWIDNFPYNNDTGAINEGYADIFGCLKTRQWLHGRNVHSDGSYTRNIENPRDTNARQAVANWGHTQPAHYSERYVTTGWKEWLYGEHGFDNGYVHFNNSLTSYPAYLMHQDHNPANGLTWNELAQLWYKSMRMGYNATSTFKTVRKCVMRAARKLNMPEEKIDAIKQAFEDVGLGAEKCTLQGTVSKYSGGALSSIRVSAYKQSNGIMYMSVLTDTNGKYSMDLYADTYTVKIDASGYVPFNATMQLEEGADNILNIPLVTPTGTHTSTITGTVRDALTGASVGGGELKVWEGWNVHTGYTVAETLIDDDGTYTLPLFAGYYTAEYSKEGYITTTINSLVISSGETIRRDIILSPTADDKYRVTLQWDENPRDLDSHLIGTLPNSGGNFHVYYSNRTAGSYDGEYVAILDHDDTGGWGFETITFQMQPGDTFRYYVHWFGGSGTWAGSNAVVNLYKGTNMIGSFSVPRVNSDGYKQYWHVFDITDGLDPVQPALTDAISSTEPTLSTQNSSYSQGATYYPQKVK